MYVLYHYLESLSELGLFAGSSESMVALVTPMTTAGHAHPQTEGTIVPGFSGASLLLQQLWIEQRAAMDLMTFHLPQMAQEEPVSYGNWPRSYQSKKHSSEQGGISYSNTRG